MAIDKDKLMQAIDAKAEHAYGGEGDSELARHREKLIDAYLGANTDPAPEGRSQIVDRTVFQTVQTMLPSLVRIYASGDEVCKFTPVGPEDEEAAEQTTAYINHIATQKNPWEQFCADWIHDAMLLPNGYAMAYWDDKRTVEQETYEGLTEDQLAVMVQDGGEIVAHSQKPDPEQDQINAQQWQQMAMQAQQQGQPPPPQPPPAALHDVTIRRSNDEGRVKLCVLPPEHCLIDEDTPDWTLEKSDYFEYRQEKTIAELREMGLDVALDISDHITYGDEPEDDARDRLKTQQDQDAAAKGLMRKVVCRTVFVRCDPDTKEGAPGLYYVIAVGKTVLYADRVNRIRVVSLTAQPLPHRHPGMSVAEMVMDIQDTKRAIKRGALDNLYLANNGRHIISEQVNLDDFLDSRPGGVVRMRDGARPGEGHVFPLTHPFVFDQVVGSLEYFDQDAQNRSGASRYFAGTDAGAINRTATGTVALQGAAAQRVEHIARMFAPAFESLFNIVHELISKHQRKSDVIKLRGKWVNIDPRAWATKRDVRVSVGVGAGNKDAMLAQLSMQLQEQVGLAPMGIVTPENIYQTVIEKAKLQGFANPDKFFTNPAEKPPQPPAPPPEVIVKQMELQADQQKTQVQMQADQQKTQAEMMADERRAAKELALKQWQAEQDAMLEKYKADKQAETQLLIAQMNAGQQIEISRAQFGHEREMEAFRVATTPPPPEDDGKAEMQQALTALASAVDKLGKPKRVLRDGDGRISGVAPM